MNPQVMSDNALLTWRRFLRAHCAITRQLDAELHAGHGLTLNDYDVLVQLREAPDHKMRMSDLASGVLLTRSGITRLIDGLVRDGYVERRSCEADARVSYAALTEAGREKMREVRMAHLDSVGRVFCQHFSDDELEQLSELLGRLPGASDLLPCERGDTAGAAGGC